MARTHTAEIVVGIDGSSQALGAAELAAREAAVRHCAVHLVHVITWPISAAPHSTDAFASIMRAEREYAQSVIDMASEMVRRSAPATPIVTTIEIGSPAELLLNIAARATMLVVGSHGHSELIGVLAGSTAVQVATHAEVPVLVSRGDVHPDGDVVVGVDGSANAMPAIEFAFDEAARRGTAVRAVHAWSHRLTIDPADMLLGGEQEAATRMLAETMAGWSEKYPDVAFTRRAVFSSPTRGGAKAVLVEASEQAQLVVVGARGYGGFAGLLLGSVGQSMLHRSRCPVAIVRSVVT